MEKTACPEVQTSAVEDSKKSDEVGRPEKEEEDAISNAEDPISDKTEGTADEKGGPEMGGMKDSEQKYDSLKSDVSLGNETHGSPNEPVLPVVKDSSGSQMLEEKGGMEGSLPAPVIQMPEALSEIPSEQLTKDTASSLVDSEDKVEPGTAASSPETDTSEKKTEDSSSAVTATAEDTSAATPTAEDSSSAATPTAEDTSAAVATAEVTSELQAASKVSEGAKADASTPATQTDAVTNKSKVSSSPGDAPSAIRRTTSERSRRTVSEGDAGREPAGTTAATSKRPPEKKREIGRSQTMPKSYGPQSRRSIVAKFEKESGGTAAGAAVPRVKISRATSLTNPNNVKQMLLDWCRAKTRDYEHVDIQNFSSSWSDGMAFCALVHKHFPDAFDYSELNPNNRRANFELAFTMAEKFADCAQLLEADDMVATKVPDWKCIYLYVQEFYRALVQKGLVKTKK